MPLRAPDGAGAAQCPSSEDDFASSRKRGTSRSGTRNGWLSMVYSPPIDGRPPRRTACSANSTARAVSPAELALDGVCRAEGGLALLLQ